MRSGGLLVTVALVCGAATACGGGQPPPPGPTPTSSSTAESTVESVEPSITREVPPPQRRQLATLPAQALCELVTPEELAKLAFTVDAGKSRELGFDPPIRACTFEAHDAVRSVLIGAQPPGFGAVGGEEVDLGGVRGTKELHVNDCTVFGDVQGATLQVSVMAGEAGADQCRTAQSVAQYVLAALVR